MALEATTKQPSRSTRRTRACRVGQWRDAASFAGAGENAGESEAEATYSAAVAEWLDLARGGDRA